MPLSLFNTLTRKIEIFTPIRPGLASLYCCGPTVYARAHIGNLRTYVFEDILRRTLKRAGLTVKHVMNITDVGHLQSDADDGDDKMNAAARAEQKSPWDIARAYEDIFFADSAMLNVERPDIVVRATESIDAMIKFIEELEAKGYAYRTNGNVYFDTAKFPSYPDLARLDLKGQQEAARNNVDRDGSKRSPQDFVLWFTASKFPNQIMQWDSPWGRGFPGWHIECSVMATEHLGNHIDIHCGGIDHIPVHHTNEIAQSECYHGHKWVNVWMHGNFLTLAKDKMSKSKGGTLTMETIEEQGYDPLHYRYLILGAHYRNELMFSWDALDGARNTYEGLRNRIIDWGDKRDEPVTLSNAALAYRQKFNDAMFDDLNTPVALAVLWGMVKDETLAPAEKFTLLKDFDAVLGLNIDAMSDTTIDPDLMQMISNREQARNNKDWATSDKLRNDLQARGIIIKDTADGPVWLKIRGQNGSNT
jgi:cysteinyl-tRNA synthetase